MFTLRPATLDDCEAILSIYTPYITDTAVTFETEVPSLEDFHDRMVGIMNFFPYIVAEQSGEIVGYAYAHFQHERAAYRWNAELSVYLKQGSERHGIGSTLYTALMALLKEQGFLRVFGVVTIPNDPSVALHERFGFEKKVQYASMGYKFGEWHDVAWFEKLLAPLPEAPEELKPFSALSPEVVSDILNDPKRHSV